MTQPTPRQLYFAVLNLMRLRGSIPAGFCYVGRCSRPTRGYCVSASLSAARHVSDLLAAMLRRPFRHDDGEWVLDQDEAAVLVKVAGVAMDRASHSRPLESRQLSPAA